MLKNPKVLYDSVSELSAIKHVKQNQTGPLPPSCVVTEFEITQLLRFRTPKLKCRIFKHNKRCSLFLDMRVNYHFHFQQDQKTYNVFFVSGFQRDAIDHSSNHALRRLWASNLSLTQNWALLDHSEYLEFLHNNCLFYIEYCSFEYEGTITIFVR